MKKLILLLLAALITLSLAACSDQISSQSTDSGSDTMTSSTEESSEPISDTSSEEESSDVSSEIEPLIEPEIIKPDKNLNLSEINAAWKMNEEQAMEALGFLPEYITKRTDEPERQSAIFQFEGINLGGREMSITLYFTGYDGENRYLEQIRIFSAQKEDLQAMLQDFTRLSDYRAYPNGITGFFDASVLSEEDIAWLNAHSMQYIDETGIRQKDTYYDTSALATAWTGEIKEDSDQSVVILHDYSEQYMVDLVSSIYLSLPQKEAIAQVQADQGIDLGTPNPHD